MSGTPTKEADQKSVGYGALAVGGLLLGGTAAVAYWAYKGYKDYYYRSEEESSGSSSQRQQQQSQPTSASSGDVSELLKCAVCIDNTKDILLEPCNHVCLCKNCADNFETGSPCPICRLPIVRKKAVYL